MATSPASHTLRMIQLFLGLIRRRRSSAAFVALCFGLITLVATAHQHQGPDLCRPAASAGEHGGTTLSSVAPSCSLCEWLTLPSLPPAYESIPLQAASLCVPALFVLPVVACFALPVPRRCPRAPPVAFPHLTAA